MKRSIAFTVFVFTATVALLAACAKLPGSQPDWISGQPEKYPASQYLVGRGQADSGEDARDRARADLAKGFEVNVAVESEDVQAFRSVAGGQYEARSSRRISARSERVLEGVEIAETWKDPTSKTTHALAVLPRLKAGTTLRQEIARLDDATRVLLDRARDQQDLLLKIAAAAQAVSLQSDRAAMQKTLRVVDPTGVGSEPSINLERLRADLDALLKRVKLAAQVTPNSKEDLETIVRGGLAAAGFLAGTTDEPDYTVEGSLVLEDLGRQDGWYWERGTLEVRLIENGNNNRVRGTKRWPIKTSALSHEGAIQRALAQTDAILKKELRGTIIGFAAGARPN